MTTAGPSKRRVAAVILAAGRGRRFEASSDTSKVTAPIGDEPLVRRVAAAALASRAGPVVVVTGHAAASVEAALTGLPLSIRRNTDHTSGLASSLRLGVGSLEDDVAGAIILLADMPLVKPETLDRLMATFEATDLLDAVIPVHHGQQGNPVLIACRLFERLSRLTGDEGARRLLADPSCRVAHRDVDDPGILIDVDTRDALRQIQSETR